MIDDRKNSIFYRSGQIHVRQNENNMIMNASFCTLYTKINIKKRLCKNEMIGKYLVSIKISAGF
jgi:hypothetical protein